MGPNEGGHLRKRTILMYGRSRSGKTSQVGEMAMWGMETTGKPSLVYSIDAGGIGPIMPYVELGVIELVLIESTNPFMFLSKAAKAQKRDAQGKWAPADLTKYFMVAIESFTGFGDAIMIDMASQAAMGINIGGQANVSFKIASDGEVLNVGGSNMAHYNVAQTRLLDEFLRSQKLPVPYVLWTASASKEEDGNFGGKVIGPAGPGKALTAEIPRHCDLCFRIDCTPAQAGKAERHIIYLGNSVDLNAGNATSLGNTRVPMGVDLPTTVEPASIVQVLKLIEEAETKAKEAIKTKLNKVTKS
jgi:hypothetical protein